MAEDKDSKRKVTGTWNRVDRIKPTKSIRRVEMSLWIGILVICVLFATFVLKNGFSVPYERTTEGIKKDVARDQAKGLKSYFDQLLAPESPEHVNELLKTLYILEPSVPILREQLKEAVKLEKGKNCLVSYALCLFFEPEGIPRFMQMLEEAGEDSKEWCGANFFLLDHAQKNRYVDANYLDNDRIWAITVIQNTIGHTFSSGDSTKQVRKEVLSWWKESKDLVPIEWHRNFLRKGNLGSRSEAFRKMVSLQSQYPDVVEDLVAAMLAEKDKNLRHCMVVEVFMMGRKESLPIFKEYVEEASTPAEISDILFAVTHTVSLPPEYRAVDACIGQQRNDQRSFECFMKWWKVNKDFLVFKNGVWEAVYEEAEEDPYKDLKADSENKKPVKDTVPEVEVEKGPFDN